MTLMQIVTRLDKLYASGTGGHWMPSWFLNDPDDGICHECVAVPQGGTIPTGFDGEVVAERAVRKSSHEQKAAHADMAWIGELRLAWPEISTRLKLAIERDGDSPTSKAGGS